MPKVQHHQAGLPADARNVIAMLRALVISQKYPYRINDLHREYRQLEGAGMDYSKFGFNTLQDFLAASAEFVLQKHQGETIITARPTKETAHMVKMIQNQKNAKSKKQQLLLRNPIVSDQSWNKSSYSTNVYQNLVRYSPKKPNFKFHMKSNGDSNNNSVKPNGQMVGQISTVKFNNTNLDRKNNVKQDF